MAFVSESSGISVAADTKTVIYDGSGTGAPLNGAVVIGLFASNIGASTANVSIYKRLSTSANTGFNSADNVFIVKNAPVPVGSTLDCLPSKIVLNQYDEIYVYASVSNTIQVTASLLEN